MFKLEQKWSDHLKQLPESGMGFQVTVFSFGDNTVEHNVIVLNTEEVDLPHEYKHKMIMAIAIDTTFKH